MMWRSSCFPTIDRGSFSAPNKSVHVLLERFFLRTQSNVCRIATLQPPACEFWDLIERVLPSQESNCRSLDVGVWMWCWLRRESTSTRTRAFVHPFVRLVGESWTTIVLTFCKHKRRHQTLFVQHFGRSVQRSCLLGDGNCRPVLIDMPPMLARPVCFCF